MKKKIEELIQLLIDKLKTPDKTLKVGPIIKLLQACYDARENEHYWPRDGVTFCNRAVQYVSKRLGYKDFDGLRANDIFDKMNSEPEWIEVDDIDAQERANAGHLVIAAWKRPEGHPGHVAVVIPGIPGKSGKWNSVTVPRVLNIGKDIFIGKGANWAFDKKPNYFAWDQK